MKYFIRCNAWRSSKIEQGMIDLVALIKQYSCPGMSASAVTLSIDETTSTNVELSLIELYTLYNILQSTPDIPTDLLYVSSPTNGTITSSNGTDAILPLADNTNAGLMSPAQFTQFEELPDDLLLKADLIDGLVPANQLPSYVDDVLEGTYIDSTTFDDLSAIPYTPESSKIYVDTTSNITYRWSGSVYVEISTTNIPTFQQVTDVGNVTTNSISVNNPSDSRGVGLSTLGRIGITNVGGFSGSIRSTDLTGSRIQELPNQSGTFALISQTVTNGATTTSPSEDAVFDAINTNNHWTKTGDDIQNNNTGFIGIGTSPRTKFEIKTADNVFFQFLNSGTRAFLQLVNNPGTGAIPLDINASEIDLKIGTTSALLIENSKVSLKQPSEIFSLSSTEAVPLTITNTSFTANQLVAMDLKNAGVVTSSLKSKVYSSLLGGDFQIFNRNVAGTGTNQVLLIDAYGLATLPLVTNALITADSTGKALITKEYLDVANYWTKTGNDIQNNNTGYVGIGTSPPNDYASKLRVDGSIQVNTAVYSRIFQTGNGSGVFDGIYNGEEINNMLYRSGSNDGTNGTNHTFKALNDGVGITGFRHLISTPTTFIPTSGDRVFTVLNLNPTINQTGGANGITRGLYINPTLTSAFDFRAIEVTAGKSIFTKATVKDGLVINNTDTNTGYNNAGIYINNSGYQGIYIDSNNGNAISVGTIGTSDGIKFFGNGSGTILNINTEGGTQTGDMAKFRINGVDITRITKDGKLTTTVPIKLASYTVATLPTGVEGDTAYVTDATAPTYLGTLTGGGTVKCPVFFNGTSWVSC